jgi:hypothetical protein
MIGDLISATSSRPLVERRRMPHDRQQRSILAVLRQDRYGVGKNQNSKLQCRDFPF